MSARNVLESQQSALTAKVGRAMPGCWQLAPGSALSLCPRERSVLQIAQGRVWLTHRGISVTDLPGAVTDHVLVAGDGFAIDAGAHVVIEPWAVAGQPEAPAVAFRWGVAPDAVRGDVQPQGRLSGGELLPARSRIRADWQAGVVLPLRDLAQSLAQAGRLVGGAMGQVLGAAGRLATGVGRFVLLRVAPPGVSKAV